MQNILPKIKTYSLSIKIGLSGKRTYKSCLCATDFTLSSPNYIRSEPFGSQNDDISLPQRRALHLGYKYL